MLLVVLLGFPFYFLMDQQIHKYYKEVPRKRRHNPRMSIHMQVALKTKEMNKRTTATYDRRRETSNRDHLPHLSTLMTKMLCQLEDNSSFIE